MYVDRPEAFASRHLLTPSLTKRASFAIDEGSLFATGTAGVVSVVLKAGIAESLEYVLAVLNSTLLTYYAVAHSPIFRGGYHKFSKGYIEDLPVRRIDPLLDADVAMHNSLHALSVDRMKVEADMDLALTGPEKVVTIRRGLQIEAVIDELVFRLYGISDDEAATIQKAERDRLAGAVRSDPVAG
jgi:restriction endonuclease TaqI-like protein